MSSPYITSPSDLLQMAITHKVKVRMKDNESLSGVLEKYDEHFNIILKEVNRSIYIRGDSIISISIVEY